MAIKIVGPRFCLVFYVVTIARAQLFSQDIRPNRLTSAPNLERIRYTESFPPQTPFLHPHQEQLSGHVHTLGTGVQSSPSGQNGEQTQTGFPASQVSYVGFPEDDVFSFTDSRFVRLPQELREQRRIADEKEFELLQDTSARFLEHQLNDIGFLLHVPSTDSTETQLRIQGLHSASDRPAQNAQQVHQEILPPGRAQPFFPVVRQTTLPRTLLVGSISRSSTTKSNN